MIPGSVFRAHAQCRPHSALHRHDDTKAIFCLDLKGQVLLQQSFFISEAGLEGIALSADGKQLFVVQEDTNAVLIIDIAARCERQRQPLAAMANYDAVAKHFPERPDNKGLEGITVNPVNGHPSRRLW